MIWLPSTSFISPCTVLIFALGASANGPSESQTHYVLFKCRVLARTVVLCYFKWLTPIHPSVFSPRVTYSGKLYQSATASITKHYRLSGLNNINLLSHSSGGWCPSQGVDRFCFFLRHLSLACKWPTTFSLNPNTWPFVCVHGSLVSLPFFFFSWYFFLFSHTSSYSC